MSASAFAPSAHLSGASLPLSASATHGANTHTLAYKPDASGCFQHRLEALRARREEGTGSQTQYALVMVNYKLDKPLLERLWGNATARICADGAINRLYNLFETDEERARFIPEYIRGDLDSVEEDVRTYYTSRGSKLTRDTDQDTTDLQKCLHLLQTLDLGINQVIVIGAYGGRIDHEFSHYAILYKYPEANIVLLSQKRAAFLLKPGTHHLYDTHMGPMCGLVPLGSAVRNVETSGLEWNILGKEMSFSGLVSTSNQFVSSPVSVSTSDPVLWVSEVHSDLQPKVK
eukprot:CAMPEP_0173449796 /NCGR_PEP_ID=MMETSP1357-20121228/43430_1 /TAXON_ID=77926 /ORGANISM="Hemiselmis rufescens, Strain PCC563" /LENGTH=287 /DNA_ID=CAMNT_0014416411 /DNA_START=57 /DNA_END=920 /DNA_ORIENTATION=+